MSKYELALVISAKIDDEARAATVEKAKGYIQRAGGVINEVEEWGKRRLAYEIQYQREAYYYFIHFEAETSAPAAIERDVRIMDNILRYLIVCDDGVFIVRKTEEAPEAATAAAEEAIEETPEAVAAEPTEETPVQAEEAAAEETEPVEETAAETAEEAAPETTEENIEEQPVGDAQ